MKIIINLTDEQLELMRRPLNGSGGWQTLLRRLQSRLADSDLELSVEDVARVLRYSRRYGSGGFQGRLTGVIVQTQTLATAILQALEIPVPYSLADAMATPVSFGRAGAKRARKGRKETG